MQRIYIVLWSWKPRSATDSWKDRNDGNNSTLTEIPHEDLPKCKPKNVRISINNYTAKAL